MHVKIHKVLNFIHNGCKIISAVATLLRLNEYTYILILYQIPRQFFETLLGNYDESF